MFLFCYFFKLNTDDDFNKTAKLPSGDPSQDLEVTCLTLVLMLLINIIVLYSFKHSLPSLLEGAKQ